MQNKKFVDSSIQKFSQSISIVNIFFLNIGLKIKNLVFQIEIIRNELIYQTARNIVITSQSYGLSLTKICQIFLQTIQYDIFLFLINNKHCIHKYYYIQITKKSQRIYKQLINQQIIQIRSLFKLVFLKQSIIFQNINIIRLCSQTLSSYNQLCKIFLSALLAQNAEIDFSKLCNTLACGYLGTIIAIRVDFLASFRYIVSLVIKLKLLILIFNICIIIYKIVQISKFQNNKSFIIVAFLDYNNDNLELEQQKNIQANSLYLLIQNQFTMQED
ncbi:transmembrane protein, putative (macronuclear) [Tetrahymena thermophila SB210]|uniref:Transmembrane protein, putative n=1 Tax=Tetrahymena thermophila (strain SB210) TaxID=312017 RepID=W7X6G5_TETTS|nr:transmembrane protein, putative [Tetrahymena thermophila SB210]EWS71948.1 transmembrane protein, putative [Tetrahymena thermophila SB210]|eukprot:XP_012655508.1 transmembrane protein, putative [Tetrahymena thermophila SB210]